MVEAYRRRATRRKLLLLECSIARYAPFAGCGKTLWELLAEQPWFVGPISPGPYSGHTLSREERKQVHADGHQAVRWFEEYADGAAGSDAVARAENYFQWAEYFAEAERFGYDPTLLPGSELRYGVASWLDTLSPNNLHLRNVLDFYLATYSGEFYCWGGWLPLHLDHRPVALGLIADLLGSPLGLPPFAPAWRSSAAVALAAGANSTNDFSSLPVLADALEDAGCDEPAVLDHCRAGSRHARGCWVVDALLGRE